MHSDVITSQGGLPLDTAVLDQTNLSVYDKQCATCLNIKPFNQFRRDASYREGVRDQCLSCESEPRLSTEEHTARLWEKSYYDHRVKSQRWSHQEDYMDDRPRWGHPMHHSELLYKLRNLLPTELFIIDGNIVGDLAVYQVFGQPQPELNGLTFKYLWYIPTGFMPEFSLYEFDERDVPIKERQRGWRTPLLRLIKSGLLTERQVDKEFGPAEGMGSIVYRRQLYIYRNKHE